MSDNKQNTEAEDSPREEGECKSLLAKWRSVADDLANVLRQSHLRCEDVHHAKKDRHKLMDECPVTQRINDALSRPHGLSDNS